MTAPITLTKKYRLRNGWEAEPLATDMGGDSPVMGRVKDPRQGWIPFWWGADGSHLSVAHNNYDLIEVPARVRIDGFVNVYRGQDGNHAVHWFPTKAEAMEARRFGAPIACIPISLDFEEGEGL